MSYKLVYTSQARKDARKVQGSLLAPKVKSLLELIEADPFANPPPFEALVGDLKGAYSRRINIQHRLVYEVVEPTKTVKVLRMWTHYA